MLANTTVRPGPRRHAHVCNCFSSRGQLLRAVGALQPFSPHQPTQTIRWCCSSVADSSRPVPSEEPGSTAAQAAPPTNYPGESTAAEKRIKGIALLQELKELVKSSNSELKAELLQQFALLQQTESEAKRQADDARNLTLQLHQSVSQQLSDIQAQLQYRRGREDGSTSTTLEQVLDFVRTSNHLLGDIHAAQKREDARAAQAAQQAKAAAASAAAVQPDQGVLAEGVLKVQVASAKDAVLAAHGDMEGQVASSSKAAIEELVQAAVDRALQRVQQQQQQEAVQEKPTVQQLVSSAEVYQNDGLKKGRRKRAVRVSAEAISKHEDASDMAYHIQDVFDNAYGKHWECNVVPKSLSDRVGTGTWSFGQQYIHLGVGEWEVTLWQCNIADDGDC